MAAGEKIVRLRKEKGWSQQFLAQKIGTSGPINGRYERGEMVPSVEVAKKLADVFGVILDYLVDYTGKVAEIKDKAMLSRLIDLELLDQDDKKPLSASLTVLSGTRRPKKPMRPTDNLHPGE